MMPSDWALKIALQTAERWWANEEAAQKIPWIQVCAEALDAARAQGKREGLEEAAGIAEMGRPGDLVTLAGRIIAADIRARIEEPTPQEPTA